MPETYHEPERQHSEEMQDIMSKPPAWLLRWGLLLFFAILILICSLAAIIRYPDIVKTRLVINSANAPKPIVSKISGRLIKLLIQENQYVTTNQPLAYLESTADHTQVLLLLHELKKIQAQLFSQTSLSLDAPKNLRLGELQSDYQNFNQAYLTYKATIANGFYMKRRAFLEKDLLAILSQQSQLQTLKSLQEKDYELGKREYDVHKKLFEQKVEALMELQREESKLLSKKYPLQQTESLLLTSSASYSNKQKEIMELDNQINEERSKFIQALNSLISKIEDWKNKYILSASQPGKVSFMGIIQTSQFINSNQEVFYINSGNTDFFGEMSIPQYNMGKVQKGQEVLIKLKSYPYEEYGMIRGEIITIAEVPYKDSIFFSRVSFNKGLSDLKKQIQLKNGMNADAEIIIQDASLLQRLFRNIVKIMN